MPVLDATPVGASPLGRWEPVPPHRAAEALVRTVRAAGREDQDRLTRPLLERALAGCGHAARAVVDLHVPRIRAMAGRLRAPRSLFDDLVAEGREALHHVLGRYDPGRGVPLWGYAHRGVRGRMIGVFGAYTGLTPYQTKAYPSVWRASDALLADPARCGRLPSAEEVVEEIRRRGRRRFGLATVDAVLGTGRRRPEALLGDVADPLEDDEPT